MKLFHVIGKDAAAQSTDPSNILIYSIDTNNNLLLTVLRAVGEYDTGDQYKEDRHLNNDEFGYSDAMALINNTYNYTSFSKPMVHKNLIIYDPEKFSKTLCYKVISIELLKYNKLSINYAHSLYGFLGQNSIKRVSDYILVEDAQDVYSLSYRTKKSPRDLSTTRYASLVVFPLTASRTLDSDIALASFTNNSYKVVYNNIDDSAIVETTYDEFYDTILPNSFPKIEVTQQSKEDNGNVRCAITTTLAEAPISDEVYITASGGYLSKTKVHTDNEGKANFVWSPMLLDAGDTVEIKCGFKNYSNVANITLQA